MTFTAVHLVGHKLPKSQQSRCSEQVKFLTTHKLSKLQSLSLSNTALTISQTNMAVR